MRLLERIGGLKFFVYSGMEFKRHNTYLKIGDPAPEFKGVDNEGKGISLSDLRGKKVILFFYPKDNTPGCTAEACNLSENYAALKKLGFEVIGVSADSEKSHQRFIKKYSLPFRLIADTDKQIIKKYDVWGKKKFMGIVFEGIIRTTFVISENGKIQVVINDVKTKDHSNQIIEAVKDLK